MLLATTHMRMHAHMQPQIMMRVHGIFYDVTHAPHPLTWFL